VVAFQNVSSGWLNGQELEAGLVVSGLAVSDWPIVILHCANILLAYRQTYIYGLSYRSAVARPFVPSMNQNKTK
jgi:hypothetical protein